MTTWKWLVLQFLHSKTSDILNGMNCTLSFFPPESLNMEANSDEDRSLQFLAYISVFYHAILLSAVCFCSLSDNMSHSLSNFTPTDFLKELLDTGGPLILHSIKPSLSSAPSNRSRTSRSRKNLHLNPLDLHNDTPTYLCSAPAWLGSAGLWDFPLV